METTILNTVSPSSSGALQGLMTSPYLGDHPVDRHALAQVATPAPMGRWHHPVPFADFIETTTDALGNVGLAVLDEAYVLTKDDQRMFGLMNLRPSHQPDNDLFALSIGLRASHDQSIARGLVAGSNVFVCSNLCFSGEIEINTKHTTNVLQRLPGMIYDAVQKLPGVFEVQEARYDAWRDTPLKPRWGDAALIELHRRGVLTPAHLAAAVREWDDPTHPEHETAHGDGTGPTQRTVWTLSNAVTEAMKPPVDPETQRPRRATLPTQMDRTVRMSAFFDDIADFKAAA